MIANLSTIHTGDLCKYPTLNCLFKKPRSLYHDPPRLVNNGIHLRTLVTSLNKSNLTSSLKYSFPPRKQPNYSKLASKRTFATTAENKDQKNGEQIPTNSEQKNLHEDTTLSELDIQHYNEQQQTAKLLKQQQMAQWSELNQRQQEVQQWQEVAKEDNDQTQAKKEGKQEQSQTFAKQIQSIGRVPAELVVEWLKQIIKHMEKLDKITYYFSWLTMGMVVLIVVGTSTIIAIFLWVTDKLEVSDKVMRRVSKYLAKKSGLQITYETATGNWTERTILLHNVKLYRPPPGENENHSLIDLTIKELEVNLSALWLWQGKGLVKSAKFKGIRGIVDRRVEKRVYGQKPNKRVKQRGDFELVGLVVEDALITIFPPNQFQRPMIVSILQAHCDLLRKQWLLYDIFCARSIQGSFDNCLFNYAPAQKEHVTTNPFQREMKLRIDGIDMNWLSLNASGPLGWIKEGTLDINLTVTLPDKQHSLQFTNNPPADHRYKSLDEKEEYTVNLMFNIQLNHLVLDPPLYTPEISYLNNALIHPICQYMNSHSKHIRLSFPVKLDLLDNFDGSWTFQDIGLWNALSEAVYTSLAKAIKDQKKKTDMKQLLHYVRVYFFGESKKNKTQEVAMRHAQMLPQPN